VTANYRRRRRAWTVVLTALLSIVLFLTVTSAVGLGLVRADTAPASDSAAQPIDRAAKGDNDIFSRRTPESLQPYYYRALLPLVPNTFHPYYHAIVTTKNYLVGVFTFGSILTCVLLELVVLTRQK
jgi:hypothetical protein